jgi:hypothetical protein
MRLNTQQKNRAAAALLVLTSAFLVFGVGAISTPASAAPNESLYNGTSPVVNNGSWMEGREDPTIDNTTNYLTRIGTFVIGKKSVNSTGPLLTGLFVFFIVFSITSYSRVGTAAGAVLGVTAFAVLSTVGLAPEWLYGITLLALAVLAGVIYIRME